MNIQAIYFKDERLKLKNVSFLKIFIR